MEFLFCFFALLSVAFVASHAAPFEDYWRSVLPNTPMPKSISELLQSPEWMDDESKVYNLKLKSNQAFDFTSYTDQHQTNNVKAYTVLLVGDDGTKAKAAAAICHTDTSSWNPKHMAFQVLKVKPRWYYKNSENFVIN